jgi:two-component system, OmpR family, manganese sensing sensor histidine kinase
MFDRLRWQLLLSYLGVFTAILGVFAIAVRLVFGYSLRQNLSKETIVLAKVAATYAEIQNDRLIVGDEFTDRHLALPDRKFEWFDLQKRLIDKVGDLNINLPLNIDLTVQFNKYPGQQPEETISAIVPIINNSNRQHIGYVRITQSLEPLNRTFHQLDIGLLGGMIISIIISAGAGIWLTRRAMKPAEIGYQRLQQFTADAAHELRSPLMAVKTNASTALKYPDGMRAGDLKKFKAIASATEQIITLTEDLLILARTENDCRSDSLYQRDKVIEQIDLTLLLQQIVAKYQPQFKDKSIRLEVEIQSNLLVKGYCGSLDRVFINLLENAIHYTPTDEKVIILAHQSERQIEINIIDTGVGIAANDLDRIFDRFWRVDRSRTRWEGGSGLGLAIARSIVERYHGSISVQSKLGDGSRFIVRLPSIVGLASPLETR